MKKINIALILIVFLGAVSCKKTLTPGNTAGVKAANGWWVTFTQNGSDVFGLGTFFLNTYNTSEGDDSLWVDDLGNSWDFKCKAKVDYSNLTFSTPNSQNQYYDIQVTLADGKILSKAGRSKSGNSTDSIYFKATFSDDPTDTFIISGTARTGFIEDDY
ncbi:MAG TPA: lipid-binding protein [Chitinophagaceae bacterium]|nr:lipid-binding protein [Chitinophagaceae bacterium]